MTKLIPLQVNKYNEIEYNNERYALKTNSIFSGRIVGFNPETQTVSLPAGKILETEKFKLTGKASRSLTNFRTMLDFLDGMNYIKESMQVIKVEIRFLENRINSPDYPLEFPNVNFKYQPGNNKQLNLNELRCYANYLEFLSRGLLHYLESSDETIER